MYCFITVEKKYRSIEGDRAILGFSGRHSGQFLLLTIMMTNVLACWAPEK